MATLLVSAEAKNVANDQKYLGKIHVDASAVLRELGYTEADMADIPSKLKVQIIRSYHVTPELHEDGDYYVTITPDSPRAEVNLIGTDRISPYDVDLSHPPDSPDASDIPSSSQDSSDRQDDQRACLVFAIWDYPGTGNDLPDAEDEYDAITDYISSTSAYDYWQFVTNSGCTYYYVSNWITWACANYESVDIYWNGHGTESYDEAAFVSYDALDNNGNVVNENLYFSDDFDTTETYDYSTLRVGSGSFCYGWGFHDTFLNPGGSTSHDRAFMGTDTVISCAYTFEYIDTWGDTWYNDYQNSEYTHTKAANAAAPYLGTGQNAFSYDDTGTSIWFR